VAEFVHPTRSPSRTGAVSSGREGFQNVGSCCGAVIFVNQSAESVAALDLPAAWLRVRACRVGREQCESAVGALAVVVRDVGAQHLLEVAAAENQEPVETLGADGADEALGVGVRLRCASGERPQATRDRLAAAGVVALAVRARLAGVATRVTRDPWRTRCAGP
jgi:hypothetical protein